MGNRVSVPGEIIKRIERKGEMIVSFGRNFFSPQTNWLAFFAVATIRNYFLVLPNVTRLRLRD